MICPACKTQNTEDSKFCKHCGKAVAKEVEDYQNLIQAATRFENEGQLDEALKEFLKADSIQRSPEVLLHIGNLFYRLGKLNRCIEVFQTCLELKPNQAGAHYGLGLALFRKAKISEAIQQFKAILRIDGDFLMAYYYLGICYYHHGELQESCDMLGSLLKKKS